MPTFGRYRIEEVLGRGGMGEVYRAYDPATERYVALKLLAEDRSADAAYQARFRRECEIAARLTEPHVVPIHSYGEIDGRLYLDMRLVPGVDLGTWMERNGPLEPDVAVSVVGQVARALDAAHADGLVHRDVKPTNILLTAAADAPLDPADVFAYLFDFGIAWAGHDAEGRDLAALTGTGEVPATFAYVATERLRGEKGDGRVDVYALACVLYETLTGHPPFDGELVALMAAHLHSPPPRPSEGGRDGRVPPELDDVVARGMAKDPDERYASAGELARAARAAVGVTSQYVPLLAPPTVPDAPEPAPPPVLVTAPPPWNPEPSSYSLPAVPLTPADPLALPPWQQPVRRAAPVRRRRRSTVPLVAATTAVLLAAATLAAAWVLTRPDPPPDPVAELVAVLPPGWDAQRCATGGQTPAAAGALAYLVCTGGPAGGPQTGQFARYPTQAALLEAFTRQTVPPGEALTETGGLDGCPRGEQVRARVAPGTAGPVARTGWIACTVRAVDGRPPAAYLLWIDDTTLTLGFVQREDGDAAALYTWWQGTRFPAG